MANIKCPKCGSMDVESRIIEGADTHGSFSYAGGRIGSNFGFIGNMIGSAIGTGVDKLIGQDYTEYHCWRCDHIWKENHIWKE